MSAPDKPDPVKAWLFAEKILEEESDRVAGLSDEDFEREMDALPDPAHVPGVEEIVARGKRRAGAGAGAGAGVGVGAGAGAGAARGGRRAAWLVAAAIGAAMVALFVERREVVAWLHHEPAPIGPEPERPVTPRERAAEVRGEAYAACGAGEWALCERRLDDAKAIDPDGESDPRVQAARRAVGEGRVRDGGLHDDKPPPWAPK